MLKKERILCIV